MQFISKLPDLCIDKNECRWLALIWYHPELWFLWKHNDDKSTINALKAKIMKIDNVWGGSHWPDVISQPA